MDLATTYLGLKLPHPFMPGASPLAYDMDMVRRLEDAGAAAIVMPSLFEEQIVREQLATHDAIVTHTDSFAEALSYVPDPEDFVLGPQEYLAKIDRIKKYVRPPVIASLNGRTEGCWLDYASQIEGAGADALELNIYDLPTDPSETSAQIEERTLDLVRKVKESISIPLAVKLSPFYTSFASFAHRLDGIGVAGLVIFNRFYQPDIDLEELEVIRVNLSDSSELLLRVRWLAILSGNLRTSLAVTGGVHTAVDAVKSLMAGADAVQMVSALLEHGPEHLRTVREETLRWLEEHEYESLHQLRGSMNLQNCPNPSAYERANYMQIPQSWSACGCNS